MESSTIFCFVISTFCCVAFTKIFLEAYRVKYWKTTNGKILDSKVIYVTVDNDFQGYKRNIEYSYQVDGVEYLSSQISKGMQYYDPYFQGAKQTNTQYKIGKEYIVYYNPKKPSDAVLSNKIPINVYTYLIIGIISLIAGLS